MGDEGALSAVADAGPIIHLAEIGCLSFLEVFSCIHIGDTVWEETVGANRVDAESIAHLTRLKREKAEAVEVAELIRTLGLGSLHAGEREALFLCYRNHVSLLLTDDMLVRQASKRLGITPVGSLGITVRAFRAGFISLHDAERYLYDLYEKSSLFVTRAIVDIALEELRKKS